MSSHVSKLRRKVAKLIEAEILTINIEIESMKEKLLEIKFPDLKVHNLDRLKDLRTNISSLKSSINHTNNTIKKLIENNHGISFEENGKRLVIPYTMYRQAEILDNKNNIDFDNHEIIDDSK
jgi:regulator of replication initiation timing